MSHPLIESWIQLQKFSGEIPESSSFFWAHSAMDKLVRDEPDAAWQAIQDLYIKDHSEEILANIAAGPLEDLLSIHGNVLIERVEELAKRDPVFKKLLGAVWQNKIPDEIWQRIKIVSGPSF